MHTGALHQQRQITFTAQQRLHPIGPAHSCFFTHAAIVNPGIGALQKFEQTLHTVVAQGAHTWLFRPVCDAFTQARAQVGQQRGQVDIVVFGCAAFAIAFVGGVGFVAQAQQAVKLLGYQFAVAVELA